eukprot:455905_1
MHMVIHMVIMLIHLVIINFVHLYFIQQLFNQSMVNPQMISPHLKPFISPEHGRGKVYGSNDKLGDQNEVPDIIDSELKVNDENIVDENGDEIAHVLAPVAVALSKSIDVAPLNQDESRSKTNSAEFSIIEEINVSTISKNSSVNSHEEIMQTVNKALFDDDEDVAANQDINRVDDGLNHIQIDRVDENAHDANQDALQSSLVQKHVECKSPLLENQFYPNDDIQHVFFRQKGKDESEIKLELEVNGQAGGQLINENNIEKAGDNLIHGIINGKEGGECKDKGIDEIEEEKEEVVGPIHGQNKLKGILVELEYKNENIFMDFTGPMAWVKFDNLEPYDGYGHMHGGLLYTFAVMYLTITNSY